MTSSDWPVEILPNVAAPLVTIPGRRPLLDLFPVFFPSEAEAVRPPLPARSRPQPAPGPPTFLFHSQAYDRAALAVRAAIDRRDRIVVLTGEPGVGKTMLCQGVVEQAHRRTLTSFVADPLLSIEGILKTVLVDVGAMSHEHLAKGQFRYASPLELADALRDFLLSLVKPQAFAVVIIDDAQSMSVEVLHDLEVLVDRFASGDRGRPESCTEAVPLLQVILVGQPALLDTLRQRALRSLWRRVAVQTRLESLAPGEVAGYVRHRLAVAGNPQVNLDAAALSRLSRLSGGVPMLVNALCDRALEEGQRLSRSVIDRPIVDSAAEAIGIDRPPSRIRRLWRLILGGRRRRS